MIAYASLAGLPPQAGLYTLLASLALYAIFGTSRHLVVAGTSASAVLVFSAVTALGPKDAGSYATLAAGMIVLTGLIFVVAGLLRLGFITAFLSRPVMAGFVFGLAIFVTVSQLPKLFGLKKGPGDTVRQFGYLLGHLGSASLTTLAVGLVALVLLFALERYLPRLPGGLIVLAAAIAISAGLGLSGHGVTVVGTIPTGLPGVSWPHLKLDDLWVLLPSAAGMMLVIFSEALGAGQTFADKHSYRLESSQEMIALGLANLGSGVLGGLACGGKPVPVGGQRRRRGADRAVAGHRRRVEPGHRHRVDAAVHRPARGSARRADHPRGLPPDEGGRDAPVPQASAARVLAGHADPARRDRAGRPARADPRRGHRASPARLPSQPPADLAAGRRPGCSRRIRRHQPPRRDHSGARRIDRPARRPMFYANAELVRDAIEQAVGSARAVVLVLDGNDEFDITSAEQLGKLAGNLHGRNVALGLAHVHGPALEMAERSGLLASVGADRVFPTTPTAVAWAQSVAGTPAPGLGRPAGPG